MTLYSRGSARRALIDTVIFRTLSQVTTILGFVILVRGIPEEDFGIYCLLYAFIPIVSMVASLGLTQVLQRYQPEYLQAGNRSAAAWLVKVISTSRFVTNIIVLAVILLAWNYIAPIVKLAPYRAEFVAFSLIVLLYFQTSILELALGSHMLHRYAVGSTAVLSFVKLVLYGAFARYNALSLETAILTDTMAYAVAYAMMRVVYQKKCLTGDAKGSYRPDQKERKRLFRYALFNNFNDAGVLLMYATLDSFFIAAYIGTVAVGIYTFYSRLQNMITAVLPVRLFDNVIRPMLFSMPIADADRKLPLYFTFLLNINLLLQWPALVFSIAYHAEIVQALFGGKFIEFSWLLPIIMGFGLINTISVPSTLVAQYEEKAGIILLSKLFAVYNILAMIVLIPLLGIYGAALAAGTAQTMKNVFIWWHVRHTAVWTNARVALPVSLTLWGAGIAVCFGVKALVPVPALVDLFVGAAIVGLFALLHMRSAAISSADRAILAAAAPDSAARVLQYLGLLTTESPRSAG